MLNKTYKLYNGVKIPAIGYGTWQIPADLAIETTTQALGLGYKHVDTATAYVNEIGVGQAINNHKIAREDIFITSKIPAEIKTYEGAKISIEQSLIALNVDYIDLMLIHCPVPWWKYNNCEYNYFEENIQVYKALEEAYKEGKVRAIGVSNFQVTDLKNIINNCTIKPMVNQVRAYISDMPWDIIDFCKQNDILLEAYSPLATGRLLDNEFIIDMSKRYKVSLPQICIRYLLQHNLLPLPKTTHKEYMQQNADVNFEISEDDMKILDNLKF